MGSLETTRTRGFFALIEREYYRFLRLATQTIAPPVIMTTLFIVIFGYSLGSQIERVSGFPYIIYILPGLAAMGAITNSYSNSSTSLFMARMDRSIDNILVAPLSSFQIVSAFVIGGVTRGLLVGGVTLLIAKILTGLVIHHLALCLLFLLLISMSFSSLGVVSALWAEDWDHLATFSNFIITPFVYLGGVFYSVSMLPGVWKHVSLVNPMFYFIEAFRWAILSAADVSPWISGGVTTILSVTGLLLTVSLFKRGYKLIV